MSGEAMPTTPVAVLLLFDAVLLLTTALKSEAGTASRKSLLVSLLFFLSGVPALIYQIVWQRALFLIYGTNAQSVAVVVTAFMLGLGLGSLIGGALSKRFPESGILFFGMAEGAIALFGLGSLSLFRKFATFTAGAALPAVILFSLVLLLVPTVLMGATLPLLVEHLVKRNLEVGASVSILYFANTFGSAVACYACAVYLLRSFGQSGTVSLAACINGVVGISAYLFGRASSRVRVSPASHAGPETAGASVLSLPQAMTLAGLSGFVALGFEIAWFRVFALASSDRAPAFALLLATYLAGVAAGSFVADWLLREREWRLVLRFLGLALLIAGALSVYLLPLVAVFMQHKVPFLTSAPAFFAVSAMTGCMLPLLCRLAVPPDEESGRRVSFIYVSNILGSAAGSLGIGFWLMQRLRLQQIAYALAFVAILMGMYVLSLEWRRGRPTQARTWLVAAAFATLVVPLSFTSYRLLFERLIFGDRAESRVSFRDVVENRNGVIGVTQEGAIFGGGVYDGYFNVDPSHDLNLVLRIYALSGFCASPRRVLVIGLSGGAWTQILVNHPQVESLDAVEINPGYLELIPRYAAVRSLLDNPKAKVYIDDGRRWLLAHPDVRYDAIVANTTYNWRDHSSALLSVEFLELIRAHLNRGGVYFFNSTESDETMATALRVFPYGIRVINFLAVSDSRLGFDKERWMTILRDYRIDGKAPFDPANPRTPTVLMAYSQLADTLNQPPRFQGLESADSLRQRLKFTKVITDDNMGTEWSSDVQIPWH